MDFDIKDSGQRRTFETGAQRDRGEDKTRPDLISPFAQDRVGMWLAKGAKKYSDHNWELGMPFSEFYSSLFRHVIKFGMGLEDEDHLAAIIFNAQAIIHFQEIGRRDLNDMPRYQEEIAKYRSLQEGNKYELKFSDPEPTPVPTAMDRIKALLEKLKAA